jgi:DNA repair exonuclease SbcCD ATPase subunit
MTAAIAEQQVTELTPAEMAEVIADIFSETLTGLIARRDSQYADAIAPLDAERDALAQESASIEDAKENLQALLPARARQAQRQADVLLLEGKDREAKAKIAEAREAAGAPGAINDRQAGISARIEAIESEKRAIKTGVFQTWYGECQHVIRAAEKGLFITLLDGIAASLAEFDPRAARNVNVRLNLTAPERSEEWRSAQKWYGR